MNNEIRKLTKLKENWNGFGSLPLDQDVAAIGDSLYTLFFKGILPKAEVTHDGGLIFTWPGKNTIEIYIPPEDPFLGGTITYI